MFFSTAAIAATAALALFSAAACPAQAFTISSPSSSSYWVANHTNTLNFQANSSDPSYFSVQLLAANQSDLNGNFQVGNALTTANGTAQITLDAVPSGTYSLLLVNSSNYQLDHPQVYFTSEQFEVKPNGTTPAEVTPNTSAFSSSSDDATSSGEGSSSGSDSSSSGTSEGNSSSGSGDSDSSSSSGSSSSSTEANAALTGRDSFKGAAAALLLAASTLVGVLVL